MKKQDLNKLVIRALRTGKSLKSGEIARMLTEYAGKIVRSGDICTFLSKIADPEKCDLARFVIRTTDKTDDGFVYAIVGEALNLPEDRLYGLSIVRGKERYPLEQALKEYPALAKYTRGPQKSETIEDSARQESDGRDFFIVGMGASAGGLEALETFFRHMPANSGMAFVVVTHMDPKHVSLMPELIQKHTEMETVQITDGIEIMPDRVHIVPPNWELGVMNGRLLLIEPPGGYYSRLPIDAFFRTLAQDRKERAIGIILSGMGTDGALGLKAIKGELGMCMAQDTGSARYDSMPKSAAETGMVDYILPPEKMPERLLKYAEHAGKMKTHPYEDPKISDALRKIFILLRAHTGHDFSFYKQNTIRRRVERRLSVHQIDSTDKYVRYLQKNPKEMDILFRELLIGVTSFFRDPDAFAALKEAVLSEVLKNRPDDEPVRVWTSGCSTGEEAYSLAIIMRECMEETNRHANIQIFATDLDDNAIEKAREGVYPKSISADVSADRLIRFFVKKDDVYCVKKDVREMLVFAPQNVIKDPPFTKLDILCCRNLLIYLDGEIQKKILPLFHYALKPGGVLFLGTSESVGTFTDLFSIKDKKWKIYVRKDLAQARHTMMTFPLAPTFRGKIGEHPKPPEDISLERIIEKALLDKYAPACVLIDKKGEILTVRGHTAKYLELPAGEVGMLNIHNMARNGLKMELLSAVRKARIGKKPVTYENLRVQANGGHCFNLTVIPLSPKEDARELMLVSFEDIAPAPEKTDIQKSPEKKRDSRHDLLKKELEYTRQNLQTTIEEMDTSNEELKSTNEELQSTNEELQSANEELETAKEEQQSLNEELVTVNAELQSKIDELSKSNNDMRNLLDSIEVPTVFLDNALCVKRFTTHLTRIIKLIHSDIGRPVGDIVTNLKYQDLMKDAEAVLKNLAFREKEVQTHDGDWYQMRILPYRTIDNIIDGVVVTFVNITPLKLMQKERTFSECVVDAIREPLVILSKEMKVVSANRAFYKFFHVSPGGTEGKQIFDLGGGGWDIPALRELLEKIVSERKPFDDYPVEHEFPGIGFRKLLLNARAVVHHGLGDEKILLAMWEDLR